MYSPESRALGLGRTQPFKPSTTPNHDYCKLSLYQDETFNLNFTTVLMALIGAHARPADYKHGNTIWERNGTPDPDRGGSKKICTTPLNRTPRYLVNCKYLLLT